jgi:hypothetical protein
MCGHARRFAASLHEHYRQVNVQCVRDQQRQEYGRTDRISEAIDTKT